MVRAMSRWIAIALVVASVGIADAKPKRHPQANNMPAGFTWPPSKTMVEAGKACEQKLDELGVAWKPAKQEGHIVDAVTLGDNTLGGIAYTAIYAKATTMDCQLALALAQVGPALHDLGVREVRFGSIYRWSKVRVGGKTKNLLSRHALGLAMDVVSFVDDAGREAIVAKDYKAGNELLHAIEKTIDATPGFRGVLTPQNDPISHHDHFHIEANPDYRN
jgi:hypothetical protein